MADYYFWAIFGFIIISSMVMGIVSSNFQKKAKHYGQIANSAGKTGGQIALEILHKNGIYNVSVTQGHEGKDHYNPKTNQIQLSPSVFSSASIYAASVAAHEVGHAIQWATKYKGIKIRDALAAPVAFFSRLSWILFMMSFFFIFFLSPQTSTIIIGVAAISIALMALFQLVTLPVEFNASKRAVGELNSMGLVNNPEESAAVKETLRAASLTYVVAFATTAIFLTIIILRMLSRRR